jgi:hypothetical protein
MSSLMLVSNPTKRRRARKGAAPKRHRRHGAKRRRGNPSAVISGAGRRHAMRSGRRRGNPTGGGSLVRGLVAMLKSGAIGAAGAIAIDAGMGQLNKFLPATLQRVPGRVSLGDGVKLLLTVVAGRMLQRPTRGLSMAMAQGAVTVQAHQILAGFVPVGLLGYAVPGRVVQGNARIGPMRARSGMNAYTASGMPSPLLNAYSRRGAQSPLLSAVAMSARQREGAVR